MDTSADLYVINIRRISGKTTKLRNVHCNVVSKLPLLESSQNVGSSVRVADKANVGVA